MESGWRIIGQGCPGCLENCCFVEKLLKCCKAHIGRAASHSRRSERLDLWRKPLRRGCKLKAMPPGSSALLLEQLAIVYSLPHWHSKCILTVLSHNQQVAIFMHVQVEGKLFMGEWTWEKWAASSKGEKKKKILRGELSSFCRPLNPPHHSNVRVYYSAFPAGEMLPLRGCRRLPGHCDAFETRLPFRMRLKSYFSNASQIK